jgi:pilus assembly protein Flp/PilA
MQRLSTFVRVFAANESGATAIEYGLICSLIVLVILASVTAVADGTTAMYDLLVAAMNP